MKTVEQMLASKKSRVEYLLKQIKSGANLNSLGTHSRGLLVEALAESLRLCEEREAARVAPIDQTDPAGYPVGSTFLARITVLPPPTAREAADAVRVRLSEGVHSFDGGATWRKGDWRKGLAAAYDLSLRACDDCADPETCVLNGGGCMKAREAERSAASFEGTAAPAEDCLVDPIRGGCIE